MTLYHIIVIHIIVINTKIDLSTSCGMAVEFKDVVFEGVVFDNNSVVSLSSFVCIVTSMSNISL